jgi:hypothetical protein
VDGEAKAFVLQPDLRDLGETLRQESPGLADKPALFVQRGNVTPFPTVQTEQVNAGNRDELAKLCQAAATDNIKSEAPASCQSAQNSAPRAVQRRHVLRPLTKGREGAVEIHKEDQAPGPMEQAENLRPAVE